MQSPFDVLGIDPDADDAEITRAYRNRVKETHPDLGGSAAEFQAVLSAYELIEAGYDPSQPPEPEPEPAPESRPEATRVEYLNYDVISDFGWTIADDDLFEKAAEADLDPGDYGRFLSESDDLLLEAAEECGFEWPYSCRGGACANCAVAVRGGELNQPANHILPDEMRDRGIRLSCVGTPASDELRVVYNIKHLPGLDELRLPPHPAAESD